MYMPEEKISHTIQDKAIVIELLTNRFTHDLVNVIKDTYPLNMLYDFNTIEFNLNKVKMIDSASIGFLFELHNKLQTSNDANLIVSVGDNSELRDLLHKFQVDLLLTVR
jgi:ABC-type transporter Mla MlaB component